MKEKLANLVSVLKSIAYLVVSIGVVSTYLKKDYLLGEIAKISAPYNEIYIKKSIENNVPISIITALKQDSIKVYIDKEQWGLLEDKLYDNKREILAAFPIESAKISKRELHDFLIVERELHNPMNGETYYIKGILLGIKPNGMDDWIWRISENKNDL